MRVVDLDTVGICLYSIRVMIPLHLSLNLSFLLVIYIHIYIYISAYANDKSRKYSKQVPASRATAKTRI